MPNPEADDNDLRKSKQQLQQLENQNSAQKTKIKSLQQAVRRYNKTKPVTSPSDVSGPDDHDSDPFSSDHDYDGTRAKKPKIDTDNKTKNNTETKPKQNGDTKVESEPGPVGPEQNGVSTAAFEERLEEQTRKISQTMQQQQETLMELIKKTHENEKLKRDDVTKKERESVEGKRYDSLHSEVRSLKSILVEQDKASELKSLRQANVMLAQSLKDRDKSDTEGRSSVLNNLKEAKELLSLFQGGSSSQTGGHASQTGGNASQTGGNGNTQESSAAGHGHPSNGHSARHAGYAGHSPQWPGYPPQWTTGYPPWADQSPSLQPSWQQWHNGYTPQPQQPPWPTGHPPQSPSHQPSWQQWTTGYSPQPQTVHMHAGQSPSHESPWPPGYPPQPPSHQPGPGVEVSGKSESARSGNRSRSPHSKPSSVSSSAVQYSRSEIEVWDGRKVQRWLHNNGVSSSDISTLTGKNGTLQDGYYLLSITQAEFMAQFPSHRSGELDLRVLWNKIDAMQQAR